MSEPKEIPYEQLVDLAEGQLPAETATQIRNRIANSPAADELIALEQMLRLMRSDHSENAPSHVINRALRLMRRPQVSLPAELTRRILAFLRFDSQTQPLAAGIRSGTAEIRQLIFVAEDTELDIRITPDGDQWRVSGQVLGPDAEGLVQLVGETSTTETILNELSEFQLPHVLRGRYSLVLHLGNSEIVAEVEIGI
jgi:hypothetical protein